MKPINFPEANLELAKNQPEYEPLHVCKCQSTLQNGEICDLGECIACFELSPDEIEKVRQTGCIWISQLTFNKGFNPIFPTVNKEDLFYEQKDAELNETTNEETQD